MTKITFNNGQSLEVETFGIDLHDHLIVELVTDDYEGVKAIFMDKNATSKITDGEVEVIDYTSIVYFNSKLDNETGETVIKTMLTYGKDFSEALSAVKEELAKVKSEKEVLESKVKDLQTQTADLNESQTLQDDVIETILIGSDNESVVTEENLQSSEGVNGNE